MSEIVIYSKNGKTTCKPFEVNTPDVVDEQEPLDLPIPDDIE